MATLTERLRNRAYDCRRVGLLTNFYALPDIAQVALWGIAAELDEAADKLDELTTSDASETIEQNR